MLRSRLVGWLLVVAVGIIEILEMTRGQKSLLS